MLNYIKMRNFRKHVDREMLFTPGINAIRASNEAGKSTALSAVAYAFFGTRALPEPLEDVVTYGTPASKLSVELGFDLAGVKYRITRAKSGAELFANGGDKPLVTGQTEVTKFVEKLLGTSQDMAAKLMLARQKDLGGALAGGPTEAGKMIENLANLDLIDELVGLVAEHLPYGDAGAVKGTIDYLQGEAEPGELPDLGPLQQDVDAAQAVENGAAQAYLNASDVFDALPVAEARATLERERALTAATVQQATQIATLQEAVGTALPPAPSDAEIAAVRVEVEAQKQLAGALALRVQLEGAGIVPNQWDQPLETLQVEVDKVGAEIAALDERVGAIGVSEREVQRKLSGLMRDYDVSRAQLEGRLVKEESCAFCGKDLKDIPEVALVNNPLTAQLAELKSNYDAAVAALEVNLVTLRAPLPELAATKVERRNYLEALWAVQAAHNKAELLYARAAAHIELDRSHVPASWTWTGPTEGGVDLAPKLRELEADRDKALRAAAAREQQQQQLTVLQQLLVQGQEALAALDAAAARATLERETEQQARCRELAEAMRQAERAHNEAKQAYELARARRAQLEASAEKAKSQLAAAEAQLAEIEANNLLVKKLRAARPAITDKLWALVLGSVSAYLGQIRGEVSSITRVEGRFKINGQPVTGLSGSAEDALGLANRLALTRTFLPNIDFLMLDEPAAACNDEREIAMLGLLATCGFDQIILVTHSTLADSFSDNIINI